MLSTPAQRALWTSWLAERELAAIAIGSSAGAVSALGELLPALTSKLRLAVMVVVHVPPRGAVPLNELFEKRCSVPLYEPLDKQPIASGAVAFAPPDYHLLVDDQRCFALSVDEPVKFSRPSIDVLFESAAHVYGAGLCGIVLTGANDDGALGAQAIKRAGGLVLVQDPATADSPAMPLAAIAAAQPQAVVSLAELAAFMHYLSGESS